MLDLKVPDAKDVIQGELAARGDWVVANVATTMTWPVKSQKVRYRGLEMVDYLAVERADAAMLDEIGVGLCRGATLAGISISGDETAQLKNIVHGFDLVGMAVGHVELDRVISGKDVSPGDIVIGVRSGGVHSNGLTLARKAFFDNEKFGASYKFDDLELSIGEELLRPTDIYVREAMEILGRVTGVKALINVTSDGLLNLGACCGGCRFCHR